MEPLKREDFIAALKAGNAPAHLGEHNYRWPGRLTRDVHIDFVISTHQEKDVDLQALRINYRALGEGKHQTDEAAHNLIGEIAAEAHLKEGLPEINEHAYRRPQNKGSGESMQTILLVYRTADQESVQDALAKILGPAEAVEPDTVDRNKGNGIT